MYHNGLSYKKISNILNEEKVLGKTNWRDSTIVGILENEIYKGDFVHGKRTKHTTYYSDVVEPIISKEMLEECQVQKKKNSRSYQRTLNYLFLQKLKCPKCSRILGGKATTKKNGNSYFYYYCNDCKLTIKENIVETFISEFIDDIVDYDSVVNQLFLPMIKQKVENPKEDIEEEIKKQKDKFKRIRDAYINEVFTLELDNKSKEVKEIISDLKTTLIKKDNYILKQEDKDKIEKYINQVDKTNNEYKNIRTLPITLNNVDNQIQENHKQIQTLTENNEALQLRVDTLTRNNKVKDKQIKDLKEENLSLRQSLSFWKDKFLKIISFIKDKLFGKEKEREKYMDVAEDLYSKKLLKKIHLKIYKILMNLVKITIMREIKTILIWKFRCILRLF